MNNLVPEVISVLSIPLIGKVEDILNFEIENPGDLESQLERRCILGGFNGIDRLAGAAGAFRQLFLRHLIVLETQLAYAIGE
jgi:hypothetical protein